MQATQLAEMEILTSSTFPKLRKYNIIAAVLHFVQAVAMLVLGLSVENFRNYKLPVRIYYLAMTTDPVSGKEYLDQAHRDIGNVELAPLVSMFFFLSALFHTLVVWREKSYHEYLNQECNPYRWIEYSISSSLMIWLIAMLFGVYDVSLLIAIFVMNAVMNACGHMMEILNDRTKPLNWFPFHLGSLLGATTWAIVVIYFLGSGPSDEIPNFVYGILASYFFFFNTFPINMILQYKRVGKWDDYCFGEFMYIVLSLASKTLLGWLVFGGVNQPHPSERT